MKCLVINGSPHKGNTWRLTKLAEESLQSLNPGIEFEEIHLADLNLPFCLGCSLCFRKGHAYCPHNKIVQSILDKMDECDGVIFSATTFNMQVPALAKNFLDHLCFMLHRPRYFDKTALVISTTGAVGAGGATKYMAQTMTGIGFNRCFQLPVGSSSYNDYKPTEKHVRKCLKVAKKFNAALTAGRLRSPLLLSLMVYNLFRGISTHYRPGSRYETYDGVFWDETGLIKTAYSPKVPLPFHKKIFGNLFYLLGKAMAKRVMITYKA